MRAVYFFQSTYALGSQRRQITGDRDIKIHSAGLACSVPLWEIGGGVWWFGARGLYQYASDLPDTYDSDLVTVSSSLDYRRKNWGASITADHTFENDQTGRNWGARASLHRNF